MGNSFVPVPKEPEPERNIVTLPRRSHRRSHTITRSNSPTFTKSLTCILCNKILNISNTDHHCEIRHCLDEFSIKFK